MTSKRANQPTFPLPDGVTTIDYDGLTVREWYAGMAMQGILAHGRVGKELQVAYGENVAEAAFNIADSMICKSEHDKP